MRRLKQQQWLLGVACTLLVMGAWRANLIRWLELPTLDWRARWFDRWSGGASPDVVVMGIDDRAVAEQEWPWGREVLAEAIKELRSAGARTVALDVMIDQRMEPRDGIDGDAALVASVEGHGGVILPMRTSSRDQLLPAAADTPSGLAIASDADLRAVLRDHADDIAAMVISETISGRLNARDPAGGAPVTPERIRAVIPVARTLIELEERSSITLDERAAALLPMDAAEAAAPFPALAHAAMALGDVGIDRPTSFDADGVYRRFAVLTRVGEDRAWPSFALAAVAHFTGSVVSQIRTEAGGGQGIMVPGERPVRIVTGVVRVGGAARGYTHFVTWPRGGREYRGQFAGKPGVEREVSISAALEPFLIRRDTDSGLRTLEELLRVAQGLNLGDHAEAIRLVGEMRQAPLNSSGWGELLEEVAAGSLPAAAAAADYLSFAGEVDVGALSGEQATSYMQHREIAQGIPEIIESARTARDRAEAARIRLRDLVVGRLVFIGWTATGVLADTVNTSLHPRTPGVYIHAAAASSFLTGFARLPVPAWLDAGFVLLMGVGGIVTARRASVWLAPILLVVAIAGWFVVSGVLLWDAGWRIAAVAAPVLAASTSWLGVMLHRLLVEQRLRRRTEERFRAYVSPAVVDELVNNPQLDSMTPQQRELSIMFCDVTGFTAIAERLGAEGTARFLSGYLGRMTDTLLRHGATIDKYLGDGIMAFWGAPIQDRRHARNACRASISLVRAVADAGQARRTEGEVGQPIHIRIGLAAGPVMVGDFGNPPVRSSYTVLGDACNIAARLERACKQLGTTILVSASVRMEAGEGFIWRPLGRFVLQGRLAPEPVFELVGMSGAGGHNAADDTLALGGGRERVTPGNIEAWMNATERALAAFVEGRLDDARTAFMALATEFGDTRLAEVYVQAIERRRAGTDEPEGAIALAEG